MDKGNGPMNLKKAIEFVVSDDPANKLEDRGTYHDYMPTKTFYINVDSMQVMREKVISVRDTARLAKTIKWTLNRSYITKNDLMVLDLIAHNNWKRPIYFAVTTGSEAYLGLEEYFQLEGLAYRLMPIKNSENEMNQGGRVNTNVMYDNITNKFLWGGLDKPNVSLDENCTRMASNMRMQMSTLAAALLDKGQKQKAEKILDLCLEKMPDDNVRYEATLYSVTAGYYQVGNMKKATELSTKLFDIYENDLKVYQAQKSIHRVSFNREMEQAKEIMRRLVMLAEQFKQEEYSKQLMTRLTANVPMEELMPQEQQPQQVAPNMQ
jgi:tetratricopeptide (TPR) repeat protein